MGYFVVFRYNQYVIRKEMMARIRNGTLPHNYVLLKICNPEKEKQFRRISKTEFSWYGSMYDVVIERKNGDTTLFYCLHDKKEENLLANFSIYLKRHRDSSRKANSALALLHNLITQALIQNPSVPPQGQGITFHFPVSDLIVFPGYLAHVAPPPKTA
jgi:hypothetical protein